MIEYDESVDINKGDVVLVFGAEWCQPCKIISKLLVNITTSMYNILHVDADKYSRLAYKFDVTSIPAVVYIKDGSIVKFINSSSSMKVAMNISKNNFSDLQES